MTKPFDLCITKKSVLSYLQERKAKNMGGIPLPNLMAEFVRHAFVDNIRLTTRMERTLRKLERTDRVRKSILVEKHHTKEGEIREYQIEVWSAR